MIVRFFMRYSDTNYGAIFMFSIFEWFCSVNFCQLNKNFVQCACVGVNAMIVEYITDLLFLLESIIDTKGCMIRNFIRWARREFLRFMLFFVCKSLGPWRLTLFVYLDNFNGLDQKFLLFFGIKCFFFTVCQLKVVFMLLAPDNFHVE